MRNHLFAVPSLRVALAVNILLSTLTSGASSHAASSDSTHHLSLARAFPVEKLTAILIPRDQWHPFPALKGRERWQALPKSVATHLIALGEEALAKPFPPLPATLYLAYARNGNRSDFEAVFFERRALLQNLALAECVEARGRFLDAAVDALWGLCEESTWCLPAHVGVLKAKVGLEYDAPKVAPSVERIELTDGRLAKSWGTHLNRLVLRARSPTLKDTWTLRIAEDGV